MTQILIGVAIGSVLALPFLWLWISERVSNRRRLDAAIKDVEDLRGEIDQQMMMRGMEPFTPTEFDTELANWVGTLDVEAFKVGPHQAHVAGKGGKC